LDIPIIQNGNLNGVENGLDVEKMSEEEVGWIFDCTILLPSHFNFFA
jgi:hypothetical protein